MLNQKISKNSLSTEYLEFKQAVEKQRKVIARKQKLVNAQVSILNDMLVNCTHEELERKESYYSGSYYDKASTDHWNECTLCGKRSEKTTKMHSYYG